ncbi:aminotransferases class-ii pyridoxal-phosphate attachment site [Lucifera butyrica]|uniref:Aminotransferases class-ii pyridoxal-phosphate attachment site n=1 Tax=Lucifera butyrica TaxID=1351585 RepID=A0A498RDG3_9FIRM|nr:pyridoxal phosphate-dependent aminotransferase family protein [Lucifera butyrica]VBB07238.1 aminotransferases class-ii pyridoxal-phosphate attachment site [Lucifera butyrica]
MEFIRNVLNYVEANDLYPDIRTVEDVPYPSLIIGGKEYLCFCSNNYLGLSIHPQVKEAAIAAIKRYGIGTCESRLVAGNLSVLEELERELAKFKNQPSAVTFITGFMTNLGVIPAIMDSPDPYGIYNLPVSIKDEDNLIINDFLNHQSIREGSMVSRSNIKSYIHKDMNHLEKILKRYKDKRKLIITDGVFSMDGDIAPLPDIVKLARTYNAMVMVDDAHGTGVLGKNGKGTAEYFGLEGQIDIEMGTLSKAVGAIGGFVAGSESLIKYLKLRASSYIYTSAIPPEQACGIIAALKIMQESSALREALWKNVRRLKEGLSSMGFNIIHSETQIIPIIIGSEQKCVDASRYLFENGILTPAIKYPVVKKNESRIRLTAIATHTDAQIDRALEVFFQMGKKFGII